MGVTTCDVCFEMGRRECLCGEYTGVCTVVDETVPFAERRTCPNPARLHPWIGAGIGVCLAHEMDERVTIRDAFGTTRVVVPAE